MGSPSHNTASAHRARCAAVPAPAPSVPPRTRVWLASYPRSGNTLLRCVLNHCFGLPSTSLYPNDLGRNRTLQRHAGHFNIGAPPLELTPNGLRLAEGAISIGRQLGHEFGHVLTGGVSDGSWTAWHGLPTLDGLGPVGGLDHTPAEYIELATLPTRAGVAAGLIAAIELGLLGGPGPSAS